MSDERFAPAPEERWCNCGGTSQPESQCPVLVWAREVRTKSASELMAAYYAKMRAREAEKSRDYAQAREQELQLAQYGGVRP